MYAMGQLSEEALETGFAGLTLGMEHSGIISAVGSAVTTLAPGTELRVGALTLRINGDAAPCTHIGEMVGARDVLAFQAALVGRRGANCTVIAVDGPVRIGDAVEVLPARVRV